MLNASPSGWLKTMRWSLPQRNRPGPWSFRRPARRPGRRAGRAPHPGSPAGPRSRAWGGFAASGGEELDSRGAATLGLGEGLQEMTEVGQRHVAVRTEVTEAHARQGAVDHPLDHGRARPSRSWRPRCSGSRRGPARADRRGRRRGRTPSGCPWT